MLLGKVDHQLDAEPRAGGPGQLSDRTNENIEPFGGIIARSRGAVQLRDDDSALRVADGHALAALAQ